MSPEPINIQAQDFTLTVEFADGQIRQIDVRTFFDEGSPKVREIQTSKSVFQTAFIEDGLAITWRNGFSLDPDVMYEDGTVLKSFPATASFLHKVTRLKT